MGSTDRSSSRYSIKRWAAQMYPPADTVLTDISSSRYSMNRYILQQIQYEQIYPPADTVLSDGQHR
jgi:hypothetical protein